MSPSVKEAFATILSWLIMIALIIMIIGLILYIFDSVITVRTMFVTSGFSEWFTSMFSVSIGLGLLTIGLIVSGSFLLATIFVLLLKNGQKLLLKLITEFED
ncbi:MAG: hypothetical protein ACTSRG_00045 [Candidatus Helarchaeota archaeon]